MDAESMVTIASPRTGMSETLPVSLATTTVKELSEWCNALLGLEGTVHLSKDGQILDPNMKLEEAGVRNGDLLAANEARAAPPAPAAAAAAGGGLDFSSILQNAQAAAPAPAGGGLDFSNLLLTAPPPAPKNAEPVYYPGMTLNDAWDHNTNPEHIVKLLQTKEHLFKELNHHQPGLASKLRGQPYERAVQIWREELMKGGLATAMNRNNTLRKEQEFRRRLQQNPNDEEVGRICEPFLRNETLLMHTHVFSLVTKAKEYFESQKRRAKVQEQYFQMMQEYPESLGRVLMLYIEAKVNGHPVQAFVDSGAQSTIMSKKTATACGLMDLLDTRFRGVAVGVGTGTILGRVHIAQLELQDFHFPVTLTIMDDPPPGSEAKDMPFLLGLDMLKRHTCCIDLENQVLKFRLGPGQFMQTPFLHEKDLTEAQGGTKGFDAEKANKELEELQRKREAEGKNNMDEDEDD
jgi:Aspartyl protease